MKKRIKKGDRIRHDEFGEGKVTGVVRNVSRPYVLATLDNGGKVIFWGDCISPHPFSDSYFFVWGVANGMYIPSKVAGA